MAPMLLVNGCAYRIEGRQLMVTLCREDSLPFNEWQSALATASTRGEFMDAARIQTALEIVEPLKG